MLTKKAQYDINFDLNCSSLQISYLFVPPTSPPSYFICAFLGVAVVHGALGTQGSETTSSVLAEVTEGPEAPTSVEGLLNSQGEDELEIDEELEQSGGEKENASLVGTTKTNEQFRATTQEKLKLA